MIHYVCKGECKGVSLTPGVCQAGTCSRHGTPLEECGCEDGTHRVQVQKKEEPVPEKQESLPPKEEPRLEQFQKKGPPLEEEPRSKAKFLRIAVGIVLLVVLIGLGIFFYGKVSTLRHSIDAAVLLRQAVINSFGARSVAFTSTAKGILMQQEDPNGALRQSSFEISVDGAVDWRSQERVIARSALDLRLETDAASGFGLVETQADLRYFKGLLYVFVRDLSAPDTASASSSEPTADAVAFLNALRGELLNQWIVIHVQDAATTFRNNLAAFTDLSAVRSVERAGDDSVNGKSTYRFRVSIAAGGTSRGEPKEPIDVDVWVGVEDELIYKIAVPRMTIIDEENGVRVPLSAELVFRAYNEHAAVILPENARPFDDVFGTIVSAMVGNALVASE